MFVRRIIAFTLFFLSFLSFLVFFLLNGIKIDSFSLGNFSISKFYIKFDKKLIVKIDKIVLKDKQSKSESSIKDIKNIINDAPMYLKYFKNIDIYELELKDNVYNIKLDKDFIYVDNKNLNFSSKYSKDNGIVKLRVYSLYLKDIDFFLLGDAKFDYEKNITNFFGKYQYKTLANGSLNLQANDKILDFFINSEKMKNIKFLKEYFRTDKIAESWMYDNVKGDYYLDYLYGKIDLDTFRPILNSIKAYAKVKNAKVKFNSKLEAVKTSQIDLTYQNDNLLIKLNKPSYKGISLDGSFVDIKDMTSLKYGRVDVTLEANHLLDENVLQILEAYDIKLPLTQLDGKTKASVHMSIPYDAPMKTYGVFKTKESTFKINDFEFFANEGRVDLVGSDVIIKDTGFKHKDMIDAKVDLNINTKTLNSIGKAKVKSFEIETEDSSIVEFKDKSLDFEIDFKDKTKIDIKDFDVQIVFNENETQVKVNDFKKVASNSELLKDLKVEEGDINIRLLEDNNINFEANINKIDTVLKKNGKNPKLKILGEVRSDLTKVYTKNKDLQIDILDKEMKLFVKGYDIDLKDEETSNSSFKKDMKIDLLDSNIYVPSRTIYSKASKINIINDDIYVNGIFENIDLPFLKGGEKIKTYDIEGSIIDDNMSFNTKDGLISLKIIDNSKIRVNIKDLNMIYNTEEKSESEYKDFKLKAENSSIILNDKYKIISNEFVINEKENTTLFSLKYNGGTVLYTKSSDNKINLHVNKIGDKFINTYFNRDAVKGGFISINASGKDDVLSGTLTFDKNRLKDLKILNNIITLVNTSPAIVNPFLAVPAVFGMVTNDGFNLNGYIVNEGFVDFVYNFETSQLDLIKVHTVGNSVDIDGYGKLDLEKDTVSSNLELVFLKDYSKLVNYIPGLSYLFLGEDKRVSTNVNISGSLDEPNIETNIAEDSISAPINILKRIITSPLKLFE